jgi:hypothetical protein
LRPLKRDLKDYGAAPLTLLQQVTTMLSQIPDEPLLKQSVDWGEKSRLIDRWARQISGHRIAVALAVRACKQQLQELRSSTCPHDVTKELYKKYVSEVYKANFEGRVPLAQHYNGTSQDIVDARLQGMRAHVEQGMDNFVAQMMRNGSVTSLRRRPMARRPIGLNEDLLAREVGIEG